jgi:hypothetical protein
MLFNSVTQNCIAFDDLHPSHCSPLVQRDANSNDIKHYFSIFFSVEKPLPMKKENKVYKETVVSALRLLQYFQLLDKNSRDILRHIYNFFISNFFISNCWTKILAIFWGIFIIFLFSIFLFPIFLFSIAGQKFSRYFEAYL